MATISYVDQLYFLAGYDPNQPRVPGGNEDGGEWSDDAALQGDWKPKDQRGGAALISNRKSRKKNKISPSRTKKAASRSR